MKSVLPWRLQQTFFVIAFLCLSLTSFAKKANRYYYQFKIYHLTTTAQEERVDKYLQTAYLPALHRAGIPNVGVFKLNELKDTDRLVYVFIPFTSWKQFEGLDEVLAKDAQYQTDGKDYIDAMYNDIPYKRMESIILKAFEDAPMPMVPQLTAPKAERVYELRSYEGPTEKYYVNKVKMFNKGDEVGLFKRLNFNAVFYSEVISGSHMPNLMYMTTFNNKDDREKHWKSFVDDAQWKTLSAMPEYQHNVSSNTIIFLHPTDYSDF
jgi:hypothetical protein